MIDSMPLVAVATLHVRQGQMSVPEYLTGVLLYLLVVAVVAVVVHRWVGTTNSGMGGSNAGRDGEERER